MHGKAHAYRQVTPKRVNRAHRSLPPVEQNRLDVGDWALAQDEDGHLIAHNVITGDRVVIAEAFPVEEDGE